MSQHTNRRENSSSRIDNVLASYVKPSMTSTLSINRQLVSYHHTRSSPNVTSHSHSNVSNDCTIQVRHHHHIELLRSLHQLHWTVVYYHLFIFNSRVLSSHLPAGFQEQSITYLHNVGLVNSCDFLPSSQESEFKGIFSSLNRWYWYLYTLREAAIVVTLILSMTPG